MLLTLDFSLDVPIYQQIRNQIVLAIAEGNLTPGEKLPTIRLLAEELGVNVMTVNKAYQLLKQEGFLITDRRNGAMVAQTLPNGKQSLTEHSALRLLLSELYVAGATEQEIIDAVHSIYQDLAHNKKPI